MSVTYVINSKDVFSSDLIFADKNLYTCRNSKIINGNSGILKDNFELNNIPLKEVSFKNPTKDKQLYDIFNAPHNRFVLHSFLIQNSNILNWKTNYCQHKVIGRYQSSPLILDNYMIYLVTPSAKDACLKLLMIHHLQHHVHAKLGNSKYGVGVFAIRYIPAGMPIFDNLLTKCASYRPVTITKCNASKIKQTTIESLLGDFFLQSGEKITYPIPLLGPNSIDPSFYLNHNDEPNLDIKELDGCDMTVYVAAKGITQGEELTIDYRKFNIPIKQMEQRMTFLGEKRCLQNI